MITRTYDKDAIQRGLDLYQDSYEGLVLDEWIKDKQNVALTNEHGDISLFERQYANPISVHGHYFFFSRGRGAVTAAQQMLEEIFTGPYQVDIVVGLTPVEHKGARWLNRKLGFDSLGITETVAGDHEMVFLPKTKWENLKDV